MTLRLVSKLLNGRDVPATYRTTELGETELGERSSIPGTGKSSFQQHRNELSRLALIIRLQINAFKLIGLEITRDVPLIAGNQPCAV